MYNFLAFPLCYLHHFWMYQKTTLLSIFPSTNRWKEIPLFFNIDNLRKKKKKKLSYFKTYYYANSAICGLQLIQFTCFIWNTAALKHQYRRLQTITIVSEMVLTGFVKHFNRKYCPSGMYAYEWHQFRILAVEHKRIGVAATK